MTGVSLGGRSQARSPQRLEGGGPGRRSEAGGAVVATSGLAEVAGAAAAVLSGEDVVERGGVRVRVGAVGDRGRVAGECVDAGDERRGEAGSADLEPAALAVVAGRVVDGGAAGRVGVGSDIGDRPPRTAAVLLPGGLRFVGAAAAAGAAPGRLALARVVGVQVQGRAADGGDVAGGGRILDPVAAVARGDGDRAPGV